MSFILASCSLWDELWGNDKQRFIETYKQILVLRELYPDTSKANRKVDSLIVAMEYTQESFRDEYFRLAQNSEEFIKMIDSARALAKAELLNIENKKEKSKAKQEKKGSVANSVNNDSGKNNDSEKKDTIKSETSSTKK